MAFSMLFSVASLTVIIMHNCYISVICSSSLSIVHTLFSKYYCLGQLLFSFGPIYVKTTVRLLVTIF